MPTIHETTTSEPLNMKHEIPSNFRDLKPAKYLEFDFDNHACVLISSLSLVLISGQFMTSVSQ